MTLPDIDSVFEIRYNPGDANNQLVGGMYATAAGYGAPIYGEAQNPSATGTQKWRLQQVDGKPGVVQIIAVEPLPLHIGGMEPIALPPAVGWGIKRGEDGAPSRIITLEANTAEFILRPWGDQQDPNVFNVVIQRPSARPVSLHLANVVALDERTEALTVEGHLFPNPTNPPPQWQFIKA
ncbi:hypothetical protein CVT24_004390 [Panaeolus cyanescens]|uniref:Ricin B lectin domain-containing protein n=1 Tax=Panaeolus cyanescens TaxID=181874 RepID=A0A409YBG3_9AGAR|nr:hypothetical protein CVT24_004390 [Panaeolus cyanescens]